MPRSRDDEQDPMNDETPTTDDAGQKVANGPQDASEESPAPDTPDEGSEGADSEPEGKGGREAKYRRRAQEAEARVAELEAAVTSLQRQVAESMAGPRSDGQRQLPGLKHPGDMWNHAEAGDVLGDDGAVSAELVASVVETILTERPELGLRGRPLPDYSVAKGSAPSEGMNWADALRGGRVANR